MPFPQPTLSLPLLPRKEVAVDFGGGELSSDGGWLLLALADQKLRLTRRLAAAMTDPRAQERLQHPLEALQGRRPRRTNKNRPAADEPLGGAMGDVEPGRLDGGRLVCGPAPGGNVLLRNRYLVVRVGPLEPPGIGSRAPVQQVPLVHRHVTAGGVDLDVMDVAIR